MVSQLGPFVVEGDLLGLYNILEVYCRSREHKIELSGQIKQSLWQVHSGLGKA